MSRSPELARVGQAVETSLLRRDSGNRGPGEAFDRRFAKMLTPEVQAQITADVQALLPDGLPYLGAVERIDWLPQGGREGLDLVVDTYTEGGAIRTDWVNVKRVSPQTCTMDAACLNAVLRAALGEDMRVPGRVDVDEVRLGWFAGTRKIGMSDYYGLLFVVDRHELVGVRAQGILSAVKPVSLRKPGGPVKLAIHKHSSKDVVQLTITDRTLDDSFDVNQRFAEAVTGTVAPNGMRLDILAFLDGQTGMSVAARKRLARALLATPDEALLAAIVALADSLTAG
jgi:hypothetical protein